MQIRTIVACLALLCGASYAQTVYNQTSPQHCQLGDWVCNQIPLNAGSYSFDSGFSTISAGDTFVLSVNGASHQGMITAVQQQPALRIGNSGPLEFTWSTVDGLSGSVAGSVTVERSCGRFCYPLAWIESSTVTVQ